MDIISNYNNSNLFPINSTGYFENLNLNNINEQHEDIYNNNNKNFINTITKKYIINNNKEYFDKNLISMKKNEKTNKITGEVKMK